MNRYKRSKIIRNRFIALLLFLIFGSICYKAIIMLHENDQSKLRADKNSGAKTLNTAAGTRNMNTSTEGQPQKDVEKKTITISAAGDCTLGSDDSFGTIGTFNAEFINQNGNYGYFFGGVKSVFEQDDLTIVNLETTFTTSDQKAEKTFRFKGDPSYVNILKEGSVEAVNIANNHIYDYLDKGYYDTLKHLGEAGIGYFGLGNKYIADVKGIKIGLLGYNGWDESESFKQQLRGDIQNLREESSLVIVSFHWGNENEYYPNSTQKNLARYAVDYGADLILGHHPHVIQGIEKYKNKYIVYSLGNFCFGGNNNPSDKDTFIFQQTFTFQNGLLAEASDKNIIPCSISSVSHRNDYRPTILSGEEKDRVMNKINSLSVF